MRKDIAAIKVAMPQGLSESSPAPRIQIHGALGVSNEMPFMRHGDERAW